MKTSTTPAYPYLVLKTAKIYTWLTVAMAIAATVFWVLCFNTAISWYCMLLLPLIILLELWYFKGVITVRMPGKNSSPSLALPLIFPGALVMLCSLAIYNVYEYYKVILYALPIIILGGVAAHKIAVRGKKQQLKYAEVMFTIITALSLYCFGAVAFINCYYDKATPQLTRQPVIRKFITTGKTKSYTIVTPDWDNYNDIRNISITPKKYDNIDTGDTITIYLKPGMLNIKWYYIMR